MTHTYHIQWMPCASCAQKIEKVLKEIPNITSVKIDLQSKQATVSMTEHVSTEQLNKRLKAAGSYSLSEQVLISAVEIKNDFTPLIIIFSIIVLFTLVRQWGVSFNAIRAMAIN